MENEEFFRELDEELSKVEKQWLIDYFDDVCNGYCLPKKFLNIDNIIQHFIDKQYFKQVCNMFYQHIDKSPELAEIMYKACPYLINKYEEFTTIYISNYFDKDIVYEKLADNMTYKDAWNFCGLVNKDFDLQKQICREIWMFSEILGCADMDLSHMYWIKCFCLVYEIKQKIKYKPGGKIAKEAQKHFEDLVKK